MKSKHENGFTLYELLVTMLIVGIVMTIGIPNMSAFTANSRMAATANDLHSSFMLARSEAARSKANITICASANSLDAAANCNGNFDDGWIIFVDLDGDLQRAGAGENLLRRNPAIDSNIDININANATYFSFAPTGLGRGDVGGVPSFQTAVLCDDRGNTTAAGGYSAARYLVVTPIGRATVVRETSIIASKGGCP
jgi:type IV fimbrial biogenesis protein FimT